MNDTNSQYSPALVNGYCLATIGDVVEEGISQTGPADDFIYLDIGSVDREAKTFIGLKTLSVNEAPSRAKQVVRSDDVLVSMTRPNLNAVAIVPNLPGETIASTGFHILRTAWLESKFLFYLVQTDSFIEAMSSVVQGALYPAVRPKDISGYLFDLPPRAEQTRIVEKLEELLSDLNAGVAELKAAQRKLAQYRQSLLKAAMEGTLTADWRAAHTASSKPQETGAELLQRILTERRVRWEQKQLAKFVEQRKAPPKDWKTKYPQPVAPDLIDLPELPEDWVWASLDQLVAESSYGTSVKCGYEKSGTPVLRIPNIVGGKLNLHDMKFSSGPLGLESDEYLSTGDVLVVRTNGSIGLVGRAAAVPVKLPEAHYFASYLLRLRCVEANYSHQWISVALASDSGRRWIERRAASSAGQHNISLSTLLTMPIPVPPLSEQSSALESLETALETAEQHQQEIITSITQAAAQRKNILKAAFTGQLVPQDPNDEPACMLLERIRAARAQNAATTKKRGRKTKETA